MSPKIKVAVIGGGFSNERDISIMTAEQIAAALPADKYDVSLIEITPEKVWLLRDDFKQLSDSVGSTELVALDPKNPALKNSADVIFIALHGKFGEDGRIQAIFDLLEIPYTGSGVLASALGMNKAKCQEVLKHYQLNIPKYLVLTNEPNIEELDIIISETLKYPAVVKPNESGSSVGVSIVKNKEQLTAAVIAAFAEDKNVMIQEYISGRELSCPVMGNSADNELLALPVAEIVVNEQEFYDYQAKYFSTSTEHLCPAPLSEELTKEVQKQSKIAHLALGCDGLSRSDFILHDDKLYFLEINTIPGQTPASISPHAAKAAGISFEEFIEKQIKLALKK